MRSPSQVIGGAPPSGAVRDGGGGGGWALLMIAGGLVEARLIGGLLEQAGVAPVHLDATDPSPMSWLFLSGDVNALVRIYVPMSQLETARLALLEQDLHQRDLDPPAEVPRGGSGWPAARGWSLAAAAVVVVVFAWRLLQTGCVTC